MKLIIDIDEELYRAYKDRPPMLGDTGMDMIAQAIANGIPLKDEVMLATLMSLVTDKDYKPNYLMEKGEES